MALKTLKGIESINGFKVVEISERTDGKFQVDYIEGEQNPILINHCDNSIQFFLQNGPIKEVGVNGCQVDTIIEAVIQILDGFNHTLPCPENYNAIEFLGKAIDELNKRTKRRKSFEIEGTMEEMYNITVKTDSDAE
ncbi:MAG: hypothetical protein EOM67_13710 [Spirochaetia bacterium]|nr:hypothetical protein [Spirochaetia bacterium]